MTDLPLVPSSPPPVERGSSLRTIATILVIGGIVLLVPLLAERVAERVQYGLTRGELKAKSESARGELAKLSETAEAFRLVAQSVGPSVVHIDVIQQSQSQENMDEFSSLFMRRGAETYRRQGQGSGVIMDEAGYIVTNYHVVANAVQIEIKLGDGRTLNRVEVVGADPATDLAVLKIEAPNLIAAVWGDSNDLDVGDWVLAVGNPYGLDRSVTAGIISAKGRREVGTSPYQDFLQTDAAVNPGNSGGPLVDLNGKVVGITTAIFGEAYQGISFAIPSQVVHEVYDKLRSDGDVRRGWLGVLPQDITPEIADQLRLESSRGAVVAQVVAGSPAQQSGIQLGDIIVEWGGKRVEDATDLTFLIARTEVGSTVPIVVYRNGKLISLQVSVAERNIERG